MPDSNFTTKDIVYKKISHGKKVNPPYEITEVLPNNTYSISKLSKLYLISMLRPPKPVKIDALGKNITKILEEDEDRELRVHDICVVSAELLNQPIKEFVLVGKILSLNNSNKMCTLQLFVIVDGETLKETNPGVALIEGSRVNISDIYKNSPQENIDGVIEEILELRNRELQALSPNYPLEKEETIPENHISRSPTEGYDSDTESETDSDDGNDDVDTDSDNDKEGGKKRKKRNSKKPRSKTQRKKRNSKKQRKSKKSKKQRKSKKQQKSKKQRK